LNYIYNKRKRTPTGQSKMDNPEDTQGQEKLNKSST